MDIEYALPTKCAYSGSAFLKSLQDNTIPLLDLLTRESIQNSLDASSNEHDYVRVDFFEGTFDKQKLNSLFKEIEPPLNKCFIKDKYDFLAIKDVNTVGLTGPMDYEDIKNNDYGNLFKLVYEISKPQERAGAGGSWGFGKTVYFRIGIGLVIFYSRIKENGKYQSRLAATFVEDETKKCILPIYKNQNRRGIAWWGRKVDDNKTIPITELKDINKVLSIFNIEPFKNSETGTTIIIPYINKKELLSHNVEDDKRNMKLRWYSDLADYLRIAIQRWYAPRLNNSEYIKRYKTSYLKAYVNGCPLEGNEIEPVFRYIKELYNFAVLKKSKVFDLLKVESPKLKEISIQGKFSSNKAGTFVFAKFNKEQLKMVNPENKESPFLHIGIEASGKDGNHPVVCYTRKPGMIVNYESSETKGGWVDHGVLLPENEFVIGIFILNSNNKFDGTKLDFEEYVRKSELAVHNSWDDYTLSINGLSSKQTVITRIKNKVKAELLQAYNPTKESVEFKKINGEFSDFFGKLLLPETGFGNKPSLPGRPTGGTSINPKRKTGSFVLNMEKTVFENEYITFFMELSLSKRILSSTVKLNIASESVSEGISIIDWENEFLLDAPFEFDSVSIKYDKQVSNLSKKNLVVYKDAYKCTLSLTEKGTASSFVIGNTPGDNLSFEIEAKLHIYNKKYKPIFNFTKEEKGDDEE